MSSEQNTPKQPKQSDDAIINKQIRRRWDFLTLFVVCFFLTLPTLALLVFAKQTIAFDVLTTQDYYVAIMSVLWLLVPLSAISGVLYIWRGRRIMPRLAVAIMMLIVVSSFVYIVIPS